MRFILCIAVQCKVWIHCPKFSVIKNSLNTWCESTDSWSRPQDFWEVVSDMLCIKNKYFSMFSWLVLDDLRSLKGSWCNSRSVSTAFWPCLYKPMVIFVIACSLTNRKPVQRSESWSDLIDLVRTLAAVFWMSPKQLVICFPSETLRACRCWRVFNLFDC